MRMRIVNGKTDLAIGAITDWDADYHRNSYLDRWRKISCRSSHSIIDFWGLKGAHVDR